ncbi:MAG: hypothetical protein KDI79_05015, partial [Anaerolineae bacterium]|nr:hypothetical protein [Anaerolineae bacterium]
SFSGSHRYILDYLTDEVLSRRPDGTRRFLLQTSILSRLCGPLCQAVTRQANSQATLEAMEAANLFIVPLDDQRRWYRYHHLFADLLRHYLERETDPASLIDLHQRAYEWYSHNGFPEEALEHALAAADFDRVTLLLEQLFWPMIRRGEINTLSRWLKKLPDKLIQSRPRLSLFCAWICLATIRLDEADPFVQFAEQALRSQSDRPPIPTTTALNLSGEIKAIKAFLTRVRGNAAEAIALYHQAQAEITADEAEVRGVILVDLARAFVLIDDLDAAKQTASQAIALNRKLGNIYMLLFAVSILAEIEVSQGHLHQAAEQYQQVLHQLTAAGAPLPPLVGSIYAGLAELHREWGDLAQATHYAHQAIELGQRFNFPDGLFQGYLALGRIKQTTGEFEAALAAFREAEQLIRQAQTAQWTVSVTAYQARLRLRQYQLDGDDTKRQVGVGWAKTTALAENWRQHVATAFLPSHPPDFTHLTLVRIFMVQDAIDEALALLTWLHQSAQAAGRTRSLIEILVLQALALHKRGQPAPASVALEQALTLAEPEGFFRLLADEGPPLAAVLELLPPSAYRDRLLTACLRVSSADEASVSRQPNQPVLNEAAPAKVQTLIEPLSSRELEVLGLIVLGLSNREIAERLVISVGTVKRHVTNIHGKLGVQSRTQAIAKARELDLLV